MVVAISSAPVETVCRLSLTRSAACDTTLALAEVSSELAVICSRAANSSSLALATRMAVSVISWITSPKLFFIVFSAAHARPISSSESTCTSSISRFLPAISSICASIRPVASDCARPIAVDNANPPATAKTRKAIIQYRDDEYTSAPFPANAAAALSSSTTSSCRIFAAASNASPPADCASRFAWYSFSTQRHRLLMHRQIFLPGPAKLLVKPALFLGTHERLIFLFMRFQIQLRLLQRRVPFFFVLIGQQPAKFESPHRRSVILQRPQHLHRRHLPRHHLHRRTIHRRQLHQPKNPQPHHQNLKKAERDRELLTDIQIAKPTHVVTPFRSEFCRPLPTTLAHNRRAYECRPPRIRLQRIRLQRVRLVPPPSMRPPVAGQSFHRHGKRPALVFCHSESG